MTTSTLEVNDVVMPGELSIKEDSGIKGLEVVDDENGIVRALVSVTGIKDRVNDIIVPGAYARTLAARTPKGLVGHDWKALVSKVEEIKELLPGDTGLPKTLPDGKAWPTTAGALMIKARYNLKTQAGRDAYETAKFFGPDQEWSIGYSVPMPGGATKDAKGVRTVKDVDLFEYSQVLWGAMPFARTMSMKEDPIVMEIKEDGGAVSHKLKTPLAMEDNKFPISDEKSLSDVLGLVAAMDPAMTDEIKQHAMGAASVLGLSALIPEEWSTKDDPEVVDKKEVITTVIETDKDRDAVEIDLAMKAFQALGAFLHYQGAIGDDLATKVAGEVIEVKVHETMFDVVNDLGTDVFGEGPNLDEIKHLAVVYDFALEQNYPDVIAAAESKVAVFLSEAIGAEPDESKQDQIKDIAAAMVELRGDDPEEKDDPVVDLPAEPEMVTINLSDFAV